MMVMRTRLNVRFVRSFPFLIVLLRLSDNYLTFIMEAHILQTAILCSYCLDSVKVTLLCVYPWDKLRILQCCWCIPLSLKADSHIVCLAHAVPLPCRAAKGVECAFPIWFTQCGRVWYTLAMPCPCHAPTAPFLSRPLSLLSGSVVHICLLGGNQLTQ
jgi:hypothetical protein